MKKILSSIFVCFLIIFSCFGICPKQYANAESLNSQTVKNYQMTLLSDYCTSFKNREPGSVGEKNAASFIFSKLNGLSQLNLNFKAENSSSTINGVQKFSFVSKYTGLKCESQNIIFNYISSEQTEKKLIIGCNYDSVAYSKFNDTDNKLCDSESVDQSAGDVVLLLSLAKFICERNLPFNIEFIFFGAGSSNNAGSKFYVKGILPEMKENILAYINIDSIALGKNIYFYNDEIQTDYSNYIQDVLNKTNSNIKVVQNVHLGKIEDINEENKLGYLHVARNSDNLSFLNSEILSLNIFSGDYEDGIIYGENEYNGEELVSYTSNDNLNYIKNKFGESVVGQNLINSFDGVLSIISDSNFVANCENSRNQLKVFYLFFGNQKLIVYLTAIVLIIIIAVVSTIKLKLSLASYDANVEPEFLSTVINISKHIDKTENNENVAKIVSQVVANDIKKDKTIKRSRKNKK